MTPLPLAHGIHLPAPRMPPELANQPARSVVISTTPSAPGLDEPDTVEQDDEEDIATVVVASRLHLDRDRPAPLPAAGAPPPSPADGAPAPHAPRRQPLPSGSPYSHLTAQLPAENRPSTPLAGWPPPPGHPATPRADGYPAPASLAASPRADETVQLRSGRGSHAILYVAAGFATFLIVIGVASLLLLHSHIQSRRAAALEVPSATQAPSTTAIPLPSPAPIAAKSADKTESPHPNVDKVETNDNPIATAKTTATKTSTPPPTPKSTAPKPTAPRRTSTGASPDVTQQVEPGFLTVMCSPFCDAVIAGGQNFGPSPVVHAPLRPGSYRVTLRRKGGTTKVVSAIIVSDKVTPLRVSME